MAVSDDGGLTFPDTVKFHMDLGVNGASINGREVSANISGLAGGKSNVVLQFIFDGTLGNANGNGYYFWMIDDIELRTPPKYSIQFVELGGAPAHDILYPDNTPKYGYLHLDQAQPINFDSNIYNRGSANLSNVRLKVAIENASGTNVTTLYSDTTAVVMSQDSLDFNSLNTNGGPSWTPSAVGTYNIIFSIESDSIPVAPESFSPMDTFTLRVTDEGTASGDGRYSYSWGTISNFVGTNSASGGDLISIGEAYTFPNSNKDTTGFVFISGASARFSAATDPTASIIWEVYDTTGFTYGANGGPSGSPLFTGFFQLAQADVGATRIFDFTSSLGGEPLALPANAGYHFIMTMTPNAANGVVEVANDQTVSQPFTTELSPVVVQLSTGSWFGRFTGSKALSSPLLSVYVAPTPTVGLTAYEMQNAVSLYPNPTNGEKVSIEITQGGAYTLEVVNLLGQVVYSEEITVNGNDRLVRDFSKLSSGVYLMNISNDGFANSQKLTIEK